MSVHERFAAWLSWKRWSQHEAAAEIGCSQALISAIVAGKKSVSGLSIAHAIERLSKDWPGGQIRTEEWLAPSSTQPTADEAA